MIAEIISVGTELLLGETVNTNASYLAQQLAELGMSSYHQTVVGDNRQRMEEALDVALSRSDLVITTGGLGPTYDDITKEIVAAHFGLELELDTPSLEHIQAHFQRVGRVMTDNNRQQAMLPAGARVFENQRGTANGVAVEQEGKIVILLPGPPYELVAMFENHVRPYLEKYRGQMLVSKTIRFWGIGESSLAAGLEEMMTTMENPTLATYTGGNEVYIRLTARADTREKAAELLEPVVEEICHRYAHVIYGMDVEGVHEELVNELTRQGKTIASAESCTGGLVSQRITQVSGSSAVFELGMCTYSNAMKTRYLDVPPALLEQYGAVSEQTAAAMAKGIRLASGADIGISTTGIAGPTGGTAEKPVGLVYVGVSTPEGEQVEELFLDRGYVSDRQTIRFAASSYLLHLALRTLRPRYAPPDR